MDIFIKAMESAPVGNVATTARTGASILLGLDTTSAVEVFSDMARPSRYVNRLIMVLLLLLIHRLIQQRLDMATAKIMACERLSSTLVVLKSPS